MPYLGNEPATAFTSTTKDTFSGDASTTDFTLSRAATQNAIRVVVENVVQDPGVAYTCSGTTLSFTSAPPTGTNNIYVVHLGPPAATVAPPTTINNTTTFTGSVHVAEAGRASAAATPDAALHVEKATPQLRLQLNGNSGYNTIESVGSNELAFGRSGTEQWRITSSGHFKAATNGFGIDFSATEGSGASNSVLDDYERGTYVATLTDNGGSAATIGLYSNYNQLSYIKIGKQVTVYGQIRVYSISGSMSGDLLLNLPFACQTDSTEGHSLHFSAVRSFNGNQASGGLYLGATSVYNIGATVSIAWVRGSGQSNIVHTPIANEYLLFTHVYTTDD